MVNQGLLGCSGSFASAFCVIQLIECIASVAMLIAVVAILVRRLRKQRRLSFYIIVSVTMILTLAFIVAFSLDADVNIFNFLYLYFYNSYFSIIAYKLATKVLQKFRQALYYKYYRYALISVFIVYALLLVGVLVYRIVDDSYACEELAFVIASAFNLTVAIVFLVMGINHIKWQEQKMEDNLPQHEQNNPLPRFRLWIALNCICQAMVLVQSIVFEANSCTFSTNQVTNEILNLIFVFICFHMGIISTLYFFMHEAPDIKGRAVVRKISNASSANNQKVEIELAYHQSDQIRAKMVSF